MDHEKERLLRSSVGALVGSDMKWSEIQLLATLLVRDATFRTRFAKVLGSSVEAFAKSENDLPPSDRDLAVVGNTTPGVARLLIDVVRRKKYSKNRVIRLIKSVSRKRGWMEGMDSMSTANIISRFAHSASDEEVTELLRRLGVALTSDPFLKGIGSREGL